MPIEFRCTNCNRLLRTADDTAGKQARCPECGTIMIVPLPAAAPPPGPIPSPPGAVPPPGAIPPAYRGFDTTIPGGSAPTGPAPGEGGAQSPFGPSGDFTSVPPSSPGSENPYQAPSTFSPAIRPQVAFGDLQRYAASRVAGPAIALIVTMGITLPFTVLGLLMNLFAVGAGAGARPQFGPDGEIFQLMFTGGFGVVQAVVHLLLGVLIILGAVKMKNLESYGFAMAAAILSMVPGLSPCCCLGLPFGIWAVVVLADAQVKSAFRS